MQNKPSVIFKNHIDLQVFDRHFLAILLDNIKKIKSQNTKPPDWPFWKQRKANFSFACGSLNEIFLKSRVYLKNFQKCEILKSDFVALDFCKNPVLFTARRKTKKEI